MITHGKKKGQTQENVELYNEIKSAYEKEDVFDIARLNPDDYMYQNKIKDMLNNKNVYKLLKHNVKSIMNNVKSYQAWYQRRYILNKYFCIENEYILINECLKRDSRNFHCWNYLRWLIKRIEQEIDMNQEKNTEENEMVSNCDTSKSTNNACNADKKEYTETEGNEMVNSCDTYDDKLQKIMKKMQEIPSKFYNLDFSNFSAIHSHIMYDYVQKLYTDPFDEGLWVLHRRIKEKELFAYKPFYIKVYANFIEIVLDKFVNEISLEIKNELYKIESKYKMNRFTKHIIIRENDRVTVTVNDTEYHETFCKKVTNVDGFVDEILEIDDTCYFAWYEKLLYTNKTEERRIIVDKLKEIDAKRCEYYQDIAYYYTF